MFFGIDPLYIIMLLPAIIFAGWAQLKVKSAFAQGAEIRPASNMTGAEAAAQILKATGQNDVGIERAQGFLGDHYDPRKRVLRLSDDVYDGVSLSALGVAAHEAGHAIQDAEGYAPLVIRNSIVPVASIGSNLSWILLFGGAIFNMLNLILLGIILYSAVVFFQLVNLPVEFDASARAKRLLVEKGLISPDESKVVAKVLNAAALTYVAATITAVITLVYYLIRFGLIGGDRD